MRVLLFEKYVCEKGLRGLPGCWSELWFVLLTLRPILTGSLYRAVVVQIREMIH